MVNDVWFFDDLKSTILIRTPSNKMEGVFKLYQTDTSEIESTMTIMDRDSGDLLSSISVKIQGKTEIRTTLDVKFRDNEEIDASFEVVGSSFIDSYLNVRPNNRMFGIFEILPPPRMYKSIYNTADATTRSRDDLATINYGDSQRMMVGRSTSMDGAEYMESFIKFDNIKDYFQDMQLLEKANLRLYYVGDFVDQVNLSLWLLDENWYEYGITHANKPNGTDIVVDSYTINTVDRYIEFDIKDVVLNWINGSIDNFGLVLKSDSEYATSFNTREGRLKPFIDVQYISNQIYSQGRTDINGTMFIVGKGYGDIDGVLVIHSDYGFEDVTATLHVHRSEVPVHYDIESSMLISKQNQHGRLTVMINNDESIDGSISVQIKTSQDKHVIAYISKPDMGASLIVDPNAFLRSSLSVRGTGNADVNAYFNVSRESIPSTLYVRAVGVDDKTARLVVQSFQNADIASSIGISKPDLNVSLIIRAIGEEDLGSTIEVPNYEHLESCIMISKPDMIGFMEIRSPSNLESTLYVKNREEIEVTLMVRQISDLHSVLDVRIVSDIDATMLITKPDLFGFLHPRAIGDHSLESFTHVRQRDASDLVSFLFVGGAYGAYYFIL